MRRKSKQPGRVIGPDEIGILKFGADFFSSDCPWVQALGSSRFKDAKLPCRLRREMAAAWCELRENILREKPNAWGRVFDA